MAEKRLGAVEARFAQIIWDNEPLTSRELVDLCAAQLNWKKSTTYTVLKKLCERGIFQNENGTVSSRMGRDDFYAEGGTRFVAESYEGSLPAFLAAFISRNGLTEKEADEIQRMIDEYKEKNTK